VSKPRKCILCGRLAFTWKNLTGKDDFPELDWLIFPAFDHRRYLPLCDECTLSADAQGMLWTTFDVNRVLEGWLA
jgi:hypothetical protein